MYVNSKGTSNDIEYCANRVGEQPRAHNFMFLFRPENNNFPGALDGMLRKMRAKTKNTFDTNKHTYWALKFAAPKVAGRWVREIKQPFWRRCTWGYAKRTRQRLIRIKFWILLTINVNGPRGVLPPVCPLGCSHMTCHEARTYRESEGNWTSCQHLKLRLSEIGW